MPSHRARSTLPTRARAPIRVCTRMCACRATLAGHVRPPVRRVHGARRPCTVRARRLCSPHRVLLLGSRATPWRATATLNHTAERARYSLTRNRPIQQHGGARAKAA